MQIFFNVGRIVKKINSFCKKEKNLFRSLVSES